jgi:hypothetical protein
MSAVVYSLPRQHLTVSTHAERLEERKYQRADVIRIISPLKYRTKVYADCEAPAGSLVDMLKLLAPGHILLQLVRVEGDYVREGRHLNHGRAETDVHLADGAVSRARSVAISKLK